MFGSGHPNTETLPVQAMTLIRTFNRRSRVEKSDSQRNLEKAVMVYKSLNEWFPIFSLASSAGNFISLNGDYVTNRFLIVFVRSLCFGRVLRAVD